jgi:hypothetical protein
VQLCREFFPNLVEDHNLETIPRKLYWKLLYGQVQKLEQEYQVDLPFVRRMMEEFVRHPLWCKRSRRPAWQVFVGRREELLKLVLIQRRRNPHHRDQSKEFWWSSPSPDRHTLERDYWSAPR